MKGRFKITKDSEGNMFFGNLGRNQYDKYSFMIGSEDSTPSIVSRMIAHDVVEHTVKHRTNESVTHEEEFRALGAVLYCRPELNVMRDIVSNFTHVQRKLRSVPTLWKKHIQANYPLLYSVRKIKESLENEDVFVKENQIVIALEQVQYGYLLKEKQFQYRHEAEDAFRFIQENCNYAVSELINEHAIAAYFQFDTKKHYFNFNLRYPYEY
jgi:hypothetical protein